MDDCILFVGHLTNTGYGQRTIKRKHWLAHRAAWVDAYGKIPEGLCVLHKCDTPSCINPKHLFLGTHAENMADASRKGRAGRKPEKLTFESVEEIRQRYKSGEFQWKLAKEFGVTQSLISRIVNHKRRNRYEQAA